MPLKFIEKHSYQDRFATTKKFLEQYPDRIPIICEPFTINTEITNYKYLVPRSITVIKFLILVREKLGLKPEQPIFLYIGDQLIDLHYKIDYLYDKYKDKDNFMYINYDNVRRNYNYSFLSYFNDNEKIELNSEDYKNMYNVIKTNWYYKQESRIVYLGEHYFYRLLINNNKEYEIRSKVSYFDIEGLKFCFRLDVE